MFIKLKVSIRVPGEAPREFDLSFNKPEVIIGRDRENDVQIPLSTVSRRHARIYEDKGEHFIEDLRSTHGTKVNGQSLGSGGKKLLRDGDQVQIVHAFITYAKADDNQLEAAATDEQTSVVARKMVQNVLSDLETHDDVPYLLVMNGPLEGKKIEMGPNVTEVVLGRGENCDVQLDDVNISRRHASIRRDWNEFVIEDLKSKNGVVVNGRKILGVAQLKDADEIYLGAIHLTFVDPTAGLMGRLGGLPAFANEAKAQAQAQAPKAAEPKAEEAAPTQRVVVESADEPSAASEPPQAHVEEAHVDEEHTDATSVIDSPSSKLGMAEYALLGLAAVVVIGLALGLALALL
jgi:pSer/pThr/pTyr-binding forkhead associated (FHA) protein